MNTVCFKLNVKNVKDPRLPLSISTIVLLQSADMMTSLWTDKNSYTLFHTSVISLYFLTFSFFWRGVGGGKLSAQHLIVFSQPC